MALLTMVAVITVCYHMVHGVVVFPECPRPGASTTLVNSNNLMTSVATAPTTTTTATTTLESTTTTATTTLESTPTTTSVTTTAMKTTTTTESTTLESTTTKITTPVSTTVESTTTETVTTESPASTTVEVTTAESTTTESTTLATAATTVYDPYVYKICQPSASALAQCPNKYKFSLTTLTVNVFQADTPEHLLFGAVDKGQDCMAPLVLLEGTTRRKNFKRGQTDHFNITLSGVLTPTLLAVELTSARGIKKLDDWKVEWLQLDQLSAGVRFVYEFDHFIGDLLLTWREGPIYPAVNISVTRTAVTGSVACED